jgi:hypothetical protein
MFGALLGADLTMRQDTIFRFLASLMMLVPNATIKTFMGFLQKPQRTRPYLSRLREDSAARVFLETEFFAKKSDQTKAQILDRLWGVIANPTLDRMFSNERNKLDLFTAMNRGSLILINTAKDLLKQEGCEILGRFFIALICQAAQERAGISEEKRMPTLVYIDEAHDYFDANMESMFNEVRKYAVGLCIAHQNLGQFKQELLSTVNSWLFRYVMSASIHGHFRLILHESSSYSRGWKHTYPVLQGKKGVSAAVALRQHLS